MINFRAGAGYFTKIMYQSSDRSVNNKTEEGAAVHLDCQDAKTCALVSERSVLKLGIDNAAGDRDGQPGKTPPHEQPHLVRKPDARSQHQVALRDGGVSRAAGVVSSGQRAGEQSGCGSGIGRGGQAIARGGAEFADPSDGIGEGAETAAAFFHREDGEKFRRFERCAR
jgi:hypothetical protein